MVAGAGLVAAAAGRWSLMQKGSCWCRKVVTAEGRWCIVPFQKVLGLTFGISSEKGY